MEPGSISQDDLTTLASGHADTVSVEDIYYCFRLILGRNPNPKEPVGHFSKVGLPLDDVVRSFVQSLEFENRNLLRGKQAETVALIERDGIAVYVDPNDPEVGRNVVSGAYEPHLQAVFPHFLRPGMQLWTSGPIWAF